MEGGGFKTWDYLECESVAFLAFSPGWVQLRGRERFPLAEPGVPRRSDIQ